MKRCDICKEQYEGSENAHFASNKHDFNFLVWSFNRYLKALVRDRNGIRVWVQNTNASNFKTNSNKGESTFTVTPGELQARRNTVEFVCGVTNELSTKSILFVKALLLCNEEFNKFTLEEQGNNSHFTEGKVLKLLPNNTYHLKVRFSTSNVATSEWKGFVAFNFQTIDFPQQFTILRSFVVDIDDGRPAQEVPSSSNLKVRTTKWGENIQIVHCNRDKKRKDNYLIPQHLETEEKLLSQKLPSEEVNPITYINFFSTLLWLEELAEKACLEKFYMENIMLNRLRENLYEIQVEGLGEKRPSILKGDLIEMLCDGKAYRGTVTKIKEKSIEVSYLHEDFVEILKTNPQIKFDVRFVLNRLRYERMHEATRKMQDRIEMLFPEEPKRFSNKTFFLHQTDIINEEVRKNVDQIQAVDRILNCSNLTYPYLIFGPPGTGKSITLVEAINQLKIRTQKRILICAPSNSACDMLALKLMNTCSPSELIRIYSESVILETIPEELRRRYSNLDEAGRFIKHTQEQLNTYRIIITTLVLCGRFRNYEPDVVVVDEAAQALETETYIPLSIVKRNGSVILAGDPRQLGPICYSKKAKQYGFEKSLLERLMAMPFYNNFDGDHITMLKTCYRCHPTIIAVPNQLFYGNRLLTIESNDPISRVSVSSFVPGCSKIQTAGKPIEFYPVMASESRDPTSPSYYNQKEVNVVGTFVKTLLNLPLGRHKVLEKDIGIVTPYSRQQVKIRTKLESMGIRDVEIGTTEAFQGREKRIIVISTVRAQRNLLLEDYKYNLGFVRNEKRFNVAMTRAKSKLIVVGNSMVLSTDDRWMTFINHCIELNSYVKDNVVLRNEKFKKGMSEKLVNVHK